MALDVGRHCVTYRPAEDEVKHLNSRTVLSRRLAARKLTLCFSIEEAKPFVFDQVAAADNAQVLGA